MYTTEVKVTIGLRKEWEVNGHNYSRQVGMTGMLNVPTLLIGSQGLKHREHGFNFFSFNWNSTPENIEANTVVCGNVEDIIATRDRLIKAGWEVVNDTKDKAERSGE